MQFRSCRHCSRSETTINLRTSSFIGITSLLSLCAVAAGQSLDWSFDTVLFGTTASERSPNLVARPGNLRLHAFCMADSNTLLARHSVDNGVSWSALSTRGNVPSLVAVVAAADNEYSYLAHLSTAYSISVTRFSNSSSDWESAVETPVVESGGSARHSMFLFSDVAIEPTDPFLYVAWFEFDSTTALTELRLSQSRDRADSFMSAVTVYSRSGAPFQRESVCINAFSHEGLERLLIGASIDRPGSPGPEILIFLSDDLGLTWSEPTRLDESGLFQTSPTIASQGDTIVCTYVVSEAGNSLQTLRSTYSLNGGVDFAPVTPLETIQGETLNPNLRDTGDIVSLLVVSRSQGDSLGQVMWCSTSWSSPWLWSNSMPVSEPRAVVATTPIAVASNSSGICAAWVAPFMDGDNDIRWDASWRSLESETIVVGSDDHSLIRNFPNPFNSTTTMQFNLVKSADVSLELYDLRGRQVGFISLGWQPAGPCEVGMDLSGFSSGSYFVRTNTSPTPHRITLLR